MVSVAACMALRSSAYVQILSGRNFCPQSVDGLASLIEPCFKEVEIHKVSEGHLDFSQRNIQQLLVMPGAASTREWELSSDQQETIRTLCQSGQLRVIGVCAGAYFASREVVYEGVLRKPFNRHLRLFNGACKGPFFPNPHNKDLNIQTGFVQVEGAQVPASFHLGGFFEPDLHLQEGRDYAPLARYPDGSLAALACEPQSDGTFGAALIGPHFEYTRQHFEGLSQLRPAHQEELCQMGWMMEQSHNQRVAAMRLFLSRLGFK